ncbi:MAG: S8 family serine peptidase [candidate division Zixibacteria bacterium]|nr:S8 family serine peptidase [candidate division Zixibacteria bacterium]
MRLFARLAVISGLGVLFGTAAQAGIVDSHLADTLRQTPSDQLISVWIEVSTDQTAKSFKQFVAASAATRAEQHALAATELKRRSQNQEGLLGEIETLKGRGRAGKVKGHWIVNVIEAEIAAGDLAALAARPDVTAIYTAPTVTLIEPTALSDVELSPDSTASNIRHVRANQAWASGYTGAGRLICSFDTGVNGLHPALYSRWKGLDGDSAAAWFDPVGQQSFPHAFTGYGGVVPSHGTHTMGIMVGADPVTFDTVGIAPGAKWISAAVIDIPGASILDAFEWAADPDGNPNTVADVPDVINHSWGFRYISCLDVFYTAIENTEALGIVNIFSAGNDGSSGPRTPADRALDSLDCFAVGNLNHVTDVLSSSSSRGPSPCDPLSVKPNVVAPGNAIRSCWYNYQTTRYDVLSGTSQAAPHVSGLVALLRQKNPNATVDQVKTAILTSTRDAGTWGVLPNNNYGWGEIDCVAALAALPSTNPSPNVRVYDFDHAPVVGGTMVLGTVVLQNLGAAVANVTATVLPSNDALTIVDGNLLFGMINANQIKRSSDSIRVLIADTVTDGSILATDLVITGTAYTDTVRLHFIVGDPPSRTIATHIGSRIRFTLTDYGVYGLATGSTFPLHGAGFTFDGGANDLWEGGLMIGTGYSKVSSGVHSYLYDPDIDFKPAPSGEIQLISPGPIADQQTWAMFDDSHAKRPLGVLVTQESFLRAAPNDDFVILRYIIKNISGASLSNLHVGLFMDWDIPPNYIFNAGGYETDGAYVWQAYNNGTVLSGLRGVKLLKGSQSAAGAFDFDVYLHWPPGSSTTSDGLSTDEKFGAMTSGLLYADVNKTTREDIFSLVAAGPKTLAADQLDTVVFALLAGNSLVDLRDAALRADSVLTDVNDPDDRSTLPQNFVLHQNYPNPFNPSTVIAFDLPRRCRYCLEVINVLGQTIYEVEADARPGRQEIVWSGEGYASGAYFYRLTVEGRSIARKMMLVK